ncbi:S1C family serine protease [Chiayiivirga flava]|uniref:Serine peptidase DegS n=1 Tax=Chiayiivirga flava TaxID=659595 RepID=A0A7W8D5Q8_9GAMM|nr:trypsin-like peptidase domain-containing protein [Chiayiivirga flava]MBB5207211.1 serine peptidase DegS [Chiayiivirga flava]
MPRLTGVLRFLLQCAVVGLALAFVVLHWMPDAGQRLRGGLGLDASPAPAPAAGTGPVSYADAVARAAPSVVSVYVDKVVTEQTFIVPNPTVQRFAGITLGPTRQRLQRAQGSGVLVSSDGYILTNHHVIDGADNIQTVLQDGRVTRARIVGSDRDTDIAVLKIEGTNLPAMPIEHDAGLRVGDVALAIGNPFGLGQTVTQGIISGLGRNQLNLTTYDDFIQTDAAINEGNSGGALVNARGELIGINTYVIGRMAAGAEGIGFAIPAGTAKAVLDQIVDHGMVVRGWLGANYGDAPILPGSLPSGAPRGVALTRILPGGPAAQAGLQVGDVLTRIGDEDIVDQADLRDREAATPPGSRVRVSGLRAGVPFDVELELVQRPQRSA